MMKKTVDNINEVKEEYKKFLINFKSLELSTIGDKGNPEISFAPFVRDDKTNVYIFVSSLANHSKNLLYYRRAGVMLIEGEEKTENIFARKRVIFDCRVDYVKEGTKEWEKIMIKFDKCVGQLMKILRTLPDFKLICLIPQSGKFIKGFGMAYEISGDKMDKLSHINPSKKK